MNFDKRTAELIAIGSSVAVNCQPCLHYHINLAVEAGVTEQEIKDAITIGRTVKKGALNHMDKFITQLLGESSFAASEDRPKSCCSS